MKRLFLDTANKYLYFALLEDDQVLFSQTQEGNNNHSETLINALMERFKKEGYAPDDIEEIYVGRGPGSYTGVRVSCTCAKVLAYSKNIKLYSFSSLDFLYTTSLEKGETVLRMDARRGFSYAKVLAFDGKTIKTIMDEAYIETTKLEELYKDAFTITAESNMYHPEIILKYQLYRPEDSLSFVPTYLRSGVWYDY